MAGNAKIIGWGIAGVIALGTLGPQFSNWAGQQAAKGGTAAAKGAAAATAGAAGNVCGPDVTNALVCAAVPMNPAGDAANMAGVRARVYTPPTTVAAPRPYGEPNGPVRQLPSATPVTAPPPADPPSSRPEIGQMSSEGGLLGELPVVGPALTAGLKALPEAVKALPAAGG